jgi:heme-degrading monooxygenase HmoA
MANITTVVHFSVPREHIDEHLANWRSIADIMVKQPGAQHGILYRCIDADSPFQFVNVAHWESPEALANGLRATAEERKRQGVDVVEQMKRLGVRMSQNNYVEEVKY